MDTVEEIKERLDIEDVIGSYVQLKQAGRNFKGVCPFHEEKTPSFVVSPEKGVFHCFGCGEGGDVFSFVQKMDGLDFPQALERLAQQAGVEVEQKSGNSKNRSQYKQQLKDALTAAAQYYHIQLKRSEAAKDYVSQVRGFKDDTIRTFQLGYAPPEGARLVKFLKKQGFNDQQLLDAGLARRYRGSLQDMFRERVMVPFFDTSGQVIGFTGRALGDFNPKYLNTPQTKLFDKSRFVFGLYQAKETIRSRDEAVVVEGNLDVLQSHQSGIGYVVAMSGTALTKSQIKQLSRFSSNVVFAFDADKAGVKATERALPLVQEEGVNLNIATLPDGKDPDDVIRDNSRSWQDILDNSTYVMDWILEQLLATYDVSSASGKRELSDRAASVLKRLQDPVEQEHYIKQLADIVGVAPATIAQKIQQQSSSTTPKITSQQKAPKQNSLRRGEEDTVVTALLSLTARYPDTRKALKDLDAGQFSQRLGAIIDFLRSAGGEVDVDSLPDNLQTERNYVNILLLRGEEEYRDWATLDRQVEAFSLSHRLQELQTKQKKQHLTQEIAAADAAGDTEKRNQLLAEYNNLNY